MREGNTGTLDRIKRLFAAPVFGDDEDKSRVAGILNIILLFILALIAVYAIFSLATLWLTGLATAGGIALLVLGVLLLMRRGHVRLASALLSWALFLILTVGTFFSGGIQASSVGSFFGVILIAGLLLGEYAAIAFAALSIVAGLGMAYAEVNGILPSRDPLTPFGTWIEMTMTTVGLTALLYLAIRSLNTALRRARHNEQDLAESNRELQAIRESLEERSLRLQSTITMYAAYMADVGRGHLSARLNLAGGDLEVDPLITLGEQLNDTTSSLQDMILQIRSASNDLGQSSAEILAVTTQQMAGASEQSAAIAQTTTTVDEVKTIADQSVTRAQEVAEMAQHTADLSVIGRQTVQETVVSMNRIKEQVEGIAGNILTLARHTQQIREIIATVNDLAAQSNMLALNAAVEAARAGEHGKGFAIVAQEVRNLAAQSRQATTQVRAILEDIQTSTSATVKATEEGNKGADEGVRLAAQTGEIIRQLTGMIDESTQAASQMVAGGRQQASGIEQIAMAMQNINQATTQSLSSTHQAERAAQDLNELARSLTETVEQYQL